MDDGNGSIEVPPHFLCPISLQLMTDPVTLCTGITYDRDSIEKWLFSFHNTTCPVTKQPISESDLTPNHTLRRLIQSWCTLNSSSGIHRIPTPKPPINTNQILKLISQSSKSPHNHLKCLTTLRSIAFESERNKNCLKSIAVLEFLASSSNNIDDHSETAIEILFHLNPSETQMKNLMNNDKIQFLDSLTKILTLGNYQNRAYATILLKSAFSVADPSKLINVKTELFVELTRVIRDEISQQATKAALKIVVEVCPWGKNRIKAVEGGVVLALIEKLLETASLERRACEIMMIALDQLCGCAEGRAELLSHAGGVAIVAKKILRVSHVASERGVKILSSICRYSASGRVVQEMLVVGAVSKLCLVLQVEASLKTKERAKEILKLHSRVWRNSPCIPLPLLHSYPS